MRNNFISGGAGFIGANLCRTLAGADGVERVVALDDLSTGSRSNLDCIPGIGTDYASAIVSYRLAHPDVLTV